MINWIKKQYDTFRLKRMAKNPFKYYDRDESQFILRQIQKRLLFKARRDLEKGDPRRDYLATIVKALRSEAPFQPEDSYTEAKELYDAYQEMPGAINWEELREKHGRMSADEPFFVVKFREKAPVKGKRFSEYHINRGGQFSDQIPCTLMMQGYNVDLDYFSGVDAIGRCCTMNYAFHASFRMATEEEIESFGALRRHALEIDKELKAIDERARGLRKQINDLVKG